MTPPILPRTPSGLVLSLAALLGLLGALFGGLQRCGRASTPLRVATFNIETYPKTPRQPELAFAAIRSLSASAVAVQEISQPDHFAGAAHRYLGESWRFVHTTTGSRFRIGVLFDEAVFTLRSTRTYDSIIVRDGDRPGFEARLADRRGGELLRLIVVHLQCCGEGIEHRRQQLERLAPIVEAARRSGERVLVLGDFNLTSDLDGSRIAALAERAGMTWASRALACTAYWRPRDACQGSALDHVLAWRPDVRVTTRGPCETEGCAPGRSCPVFYGEVSDHCPVTVDLP